MTSGLPRCVDPGGTIGIVSPAFAVADSILEAGIRRIEGWGFRTRVFRSSAARFGRLAGGDAARAHALWHAFADLDVQLVMATCGGYGCTRLLKHLPFFPPGAAGALVGYSDLTALLLSTSAAGGHAIHGPMLEDIANGLDALSEIAFLALLAGDLNEYNKALAAAAADLTMARPGRAAAPMTGGNLSVLASLLGTPQSPATTGCLLFLEDWNEPHYRIDRLLTHVAQADIFAGVAGVVLGSFTNITRLGEDLPVSIAERVVELVPVDRPVVAGFPAGHDRAKLAFPIGERMVVGDGPPRLAPISR